MDAKRNPRQRAKRRSDVEGTAKLTRRPDLTALGAAQFVQMLHAGIPADKALCYFSVDYYESCTKDQIKRWLTEWCNDPLLVQATTEFTKGEWHTLDADSRLQLALDKHLAELAYLLYTTDYRTADPVDVRKLDTAREAIAAQLKELAGGEETPWMKAMRELLAGSLDAHGLTPPQVESVPVVRKHKGES